MIFLASLQVGEASDHGEDSDFEVDAEGGTCCAHFLSNEKRVPSRL